MQLEYNGVQLELLNLDQVSREAVYSSDGQDLMYIKWVIGATCIYSPGGYPVGTAVKSISNTTREELYPSNTLTTGPRNILLGNDPEIGPVSQRTNIGRGRHQSSQTAVMTDVELKNRLWIPRRKLRITVWDDYGQKQTWLESPKPGLHCDLAGGPKPIALDVVQAQGEGLTFGVHFQIMTHLSPCPDGSDRLILSHRWQMEHDHDEDQYLTRTIHGEVVFNHALLETSGVSPDWFRSQFLHPIPLGMKRKPPRVVQSSDGSTIQYTLTDTDTSVMFDAGDSGATEIEIIENVSYTNPWRY